MEVMKGEVKEIKKTKRREGEEKKRRKEEKEKRRKEEKEKRRKTGMKKNNDSKRVTYLVHPTMYFRQHRQRRSTRPVTYRVKIAQRPGTGMP